ncbi:hypothetical protein BS630_26225 [Rhizobium laguerreae]|nr:hypothetical protein BS630_26225 [Rhizobium laguerreae]
MPFPLQFQCWMESIFKQYSYLYDMATCAIIHRLSNRTPAMWHDTARRELTAIRIVPFRQPSLTRS